jgi:hypothetical protein
MARPVVPLLRLVQERRFDPDNKRHRAKLLNDDSWLEFVAGNEDAPARLRELAGLQRQYRTSRGAWAARAFQRQVEAGHGDGGPLVTPVTAGHQLPAAATVFLPALFDRSANGPFLTPSTFTRKPSRLDARIGQHHR